MASIAIVYHSGYGHTQRQAQVIAEAAGGQLIAIDADGNIPEAAWAQLRRQRAVDRLPCSGAQSSWMALVQKPSAPGWLA